MAYEKECDIILTDLSYIANKANPAFRTLFDYELAENSHGRAYIYDAWYAAVIILLNEEFIYRIDNGNNSVMSATRFGLTAKGMAFINTDSHVERKERWERERDINKQQHKLNEWTLSKRKCTYFMALIAFILSSVQVVLSLVGHTPKSLIEAISKALQ